MGYCCECRNAFTLQKTGEYFVAKQSQPRAERSLSDITYILELMFENKTSFPVIND
jgi:hypothetical protein